MFKFMPKEHPFFDLFDHAARNALDAAKALHELMENFTDLENKAKRLENIEHAGDEIAHRVYGLIETTFITPLDREDIHALTKLLDDITDRTEMTATRLVTYRVTQSTEDAKALSRVLLQSVTLVVEAIGMLRDLKQSEKILARCIDINTQEDEGDRIYQHALGALFDGQASAIDIIKWKDIYHCMENATDVCEDLANVLQAIVTKNA
jgi:uncharacterized protein Yka (UPF0111/DUF47 family)